MKARLVLLALVAAVLMPGYAMAQSSTVVFYTAVYYSGLDESTGPDVDATLSCNAGIPLEQTAAVGPITDEGDIFDEGIWFTVTEMPNDLGTCTVTFGDIPDGWEAWGAFYFHELGIGLPYYGESSCTFSNTDEMYPPIWDEQGCILILIPEEVDFEVTVDWSISPDADVGVGNYAYGFLECGNLWSGDIGLIYSYPYSATTLPAGPDDDMPLVLSNIRPDPDGDSWCYANLYGTGSAVETDNYECWYEGVDLEVGGDSSCTITATAFYEGVPTLSQYGMAIMVLLMLGVGFVGFRRIV